MLGDTLLESVFPFFLGKEKVVLCFEEIITFSILYNLTTEFNLDVCHQVSSNVIHERVCSHDLSHSD